MAWTLENMRDRLRTTLGLPSSSGVSDSLLNDYLNTCLRFTMPLTLYPPALRREFTIGTETDKYQYGLDSDMLSVIGNPYIEDSRIQLTYDYDYFFDRFDEDDKDQPTLALLFSNQLYLQPVPDDIYTVTIIALARPEKLEDDDDEIFNDSWALPTVYGAAVEFARDHGDLETASTVQELFKYATDLARREELLRWGNKRATPEL